MPHVAAGLSHIHSLGINIVVEQSLLDLMHRHHQQSIDFPVDMYSPDMNDIDLIVTFGGDGLLLHCNALFGKRYMPPVMSFDFGSLGFLSPFLFENFEKEVSALSLYCITRQLW
jgi:NAD kinase